jgi:predicted amidohydrolase
MIVAAAQTSPKRGEIEYNLEQHYKLCEKAVASNARLIVFPELSICGYEREDAYKYFFTPDDARLLGLKKISVAEKITIIAGAPIKIKTELYIGSFIFSPQGKISIYTKQYLHEGEELYYKSSFDYNPQLILGNNRISLGICADVENVKHVREARNRSSNIYMPSIFYTPGSIIKLHEKLSNYAKDYCLNILMSNFCGESYNQKAGGKSAFWNKKGKKISELNETHPGVLIVENFGQEYNASPFYL